MPKKGSKPALPPLLELGTSRRPSAELRDFYDEELEHSRNVFDPNEHPEIASIPDSPQEFLERFEDTREVQRVLVHDVLTNLHALRKNNYRVHGKTMYKHQRALEFWSATTLAGGKNAPNSILLRGGPGIGKTLILGRLMQAGIHAQLRGLLPKGIIAYFTQRPFHLVQQTRGYGLARRRLLRTPGCTLAEKEIDSLYQECKKMIPVLCKAISIVEWRQLFSTTPENEADARWHIQNLLLKKGTLKTVTELPNYESEEMQLIRLLQGSATTVEGIKKNRELVDLPAFAEDQEIHTSFGGDAAFAIPDNYPVLAKDRWGMNVNDEQHPKVLLLPAAALTSTMQREKLRTILKDVVLILPDEAGNWHPTVFENPVLEAGGAMPVVIGAAATDQRKNWQARSPEHSVSRSVEDGILPDVGIDIFPSQKELHYPRDSMEALSQLVTHHFEELPLMKRLNLQQPYEGNGLVVVHASVTRECAQMLQEAHDKRKTGGKVFCLDGKTPQADKEKLLLWLGSETVYPKVLVGNPASLSTALDLPNIWNVTLGTNVSKTQMTQILGRALHSAGPRALFCQQQFSDSNLSTTPFAELEHRVDLPTEGGFRWVPGHALMSERAYRKDQRAVKKSPPLPSIEVPPAIRSAMKTQDFVKVGQGTAASVFLHPRIKVALDVLCSNPTNITVSALADAYREIGNTHMAGVVGTYGATLSLNATENRAAPNSREIFCTKLMQLAEKRNGHVS